MELSHARDQEIGTRGPEPSRLLIPWELIRVARLGLMASHVWLFILPVVLSAEVPAVQFWIGAVYVTLPLGLLIYGWNDFFDADVDAISRRKKESPMAAWFGYRLRPEKRKLLPLTIAAAHLPFLILAVVAGAFWVLAWLAVMVLANALYNGPGLRLSRVPVLAEFTATWIYLNILWLSVAATGYNQPWPVWALAAVAILVFQIAGAIVDLRSDAEVGKVTFAVAVGEPWASRALAALVAGKAALFLVWFHAPPAAALNLLAVPFCLARPTLPRGQWAGAVYAYFVVADWGALVTLAGGGSGS